MLSRGSFGRSSEGERQGRSNPTTAIKAKWRQFLGRDPGCRSGGGIAREDGRGKFSVQTAHVVDELGKGGVDGLMQLADAIAELEYGLFP
jgi:hypothetical protein